MYSGFDFVWLYRRCDQLAFLDAHVRAFAFFNGIPARCVYDNLSAAVSRRAGIYGIKHQLTAQVATAKNAAGESVAQRWQHEQSLLRPLPAPPFEARLQRRVPISSRATVQIDGAIYSVPSRWARLEATALIGGDEISLHCQGATEVHPRQPKGGKSIRYRHYLNELAHKPQALRQVATALLAQLGEPFAQLWQVLANTHGELEAARVLARLLAALGHHDEQTIRTALGQALSQRALTLSTSEPKAQTPLLEQRVRLSRLCLPVSW
jgi:hypothetical protein